MKQYKLNTHLISGYRKDEEIPKEVKDDLISEGCPESWFSAVEEEVAEGQYWRLGTQIVRVYDVDNNGVKYGYIGKHQSNDKHWYRKTDFPKECSKLDTDSITEALIAEAKRRGYTYTNFECLIANSISFEHGGYEYDKSVDVLYLSNNACYLQGQWASIVDEPIRINGNEVFFDDNANYFKVGCRDIYKKDFRSFSKLVISNGLKVSYKGEDITKQIKQIANKL